MRTALGDTSALTVEFSVERAAEPGTSAADAGTINGVAVNRCAVCNHVKGPGTRCRCPPCGKWLVVGNTDLRKIEKMLRKRFSPAKMTQIAQKATTNLAEQPNSLLASYESGKMQNVNGKGTAQYYMDLVVLQV